MVLQISRGVRAKIPLESDIRERKADIGPILRQLSEEKEAENVETEACVDHIHMLVSILTHLSVAHGISQRKKYTYDIRPSHPVRGGTELFALLCKFHGFQSTHPVRGGTAINYKNYFAIYAKLTKINQLPNPCKSLTSYMGHRETYDASFFGANILRDFCSPGLRTIRP